MVGAVVWVHACAHLYACGFGEEYNRLLYVTVEVQKDLQLNVKQMVDV